MRLYFDFNAFDTAQAYDAFSAFRGAHAHVRALNAQWLTPWQFNLHGLPISEPWAVVSDNPCAEFMENKWDLGASALMRFADLMRYEEIAARTLIASRFREIRKYDGLLTPAERQVLRLTAHGFALEDIAAVLAKSPRTARDNQMNVKDKLRARYPNWGFLRPQHLGHYYFGQWWLLDDYASHRARHREQPPQ